MESKMKITFTLFVIIVGYNFVDGQGTELETGKLHEGKLKEKILEKSGQTRIVGGKKATKSYPYQVSLETPSIIFGDTVYSWSHICGGSIISTQHILSAGLFDVFHLPLAYLQFYFTLLSNAV